MCRDNIGTFDVLDLTLLQEDEQHESHQSTYLQHKPTDKSIQRAAQMTGNPHLGCGHHNSVRGPQRRGDGRSIEVLGSPISISNKLFLDDESLCIKTTTYALIKVVEDCVVVLDGHSSFPYNRDDNVADERLDVGADRRDTKRWPGCG